MVKQSESSVLGIPEDMKERLRAFIRRESVLLDDAAAPTERMEQLERHVERLAKRCSALEAQNILVSVQVLDIVAQIAAWALSLSSLALYVYLVTTCFSSLLLRVALLAMPYVYNRRTHGSFHRRFEVFAIAFIVIMRVRLCRWRERMFMDADPDNIAEFGESLTEDAIWEANYEVSARFLYVSILRLKGLWTKTAQYLSSRADFMPKAYVRELKRLQDEAPATSWIDVTVPEHILAALSDVDETPLASASIGQVHTAFLRSTGEKVVVKVQHPHARSLLLDDFWSLAVIMRIVSWMEPDYEFLEILMREWAKESRHELDFATEAQNLRDAQHAIRQLWTSKDTTVMATDENGTEVPFSVEIPRPIDALCTNDVLVMTYCEGVRLDDFAQLAEWNLSREAIVGAVSQTFAHMMYNTQLFNGDPHIGNLLVRPGTGASKTKGFSLVLLDWGLAKRMPDEKRLAFCKLVYAASTFDFGLLLDAYKELGLRLKKENVGRSMAGVRFMLRDMATREKARKRIKAKLKSEQDHIQQNPKEDKVQIQSKAYPGEMFFFVRVNELLHGLGSRFDVDMKYLELLRPYAERGLREAADREVPRVERLIIPGTIDRNLEEKLHSTLFELEKDGKLVGAQICILNSNGDALADVVAGSLGGLKSHIPMQADALILGYSCTKAVTATLAHLMVKQGYLSYDEPICERVWPKFCPGEKAPPNLYSVLGLEKDEVAKRWNWKRQISLWHILTHQAGLAMTLPSHLTIKDLASCEYCSASYEFDAENPENTLLPSKAPGTESSYHAMSFGWLVAGALCGAYALRHKLPSISFKEVYEKVLEPRLSSSVLSKGFRPCGGSGDFVLAQTAISETSMSSVLQRRREMTAMGEKEEEESSESAIAEVLKSFKGKEFLLDPRIWNSTDALDANVPAAGGRFSAAGLARFYHELMSGSIIDRDIIEKISSLKVSEKKASDLEGVTSLSADDRMAMGCGYQLLYFDKDTDQPSGFGHAGVGGSIGVHHRPTGLSMALMLNKADQTTEATLKIMRVVGEYFDI